ncbi:hypothetical protein CR513_05402, partial [Mucuna pruriens]
MPTTTIPTATTTESAATRKLAISRGPDEAICYKELPQQAAPQQNPRPVDAESEPEADSLIPQ